MQQTTERTSNEERVTRAGALKCAALVHRGADCSLAQVMLSAKRLIRWLEGEEVIG